MNPPAASWLPAGFELWPPLWQAATLGLLTFVQEDVPAVSGAVLAARGSLSWGTSFAGIFLGIWLGDALLYLLARSGGRSLLERRWARRFVSEAAVARSEQWFAQRGTWLLFSSRFIPGTRLPTYVAAGLLRLPFARFLLVTGSAVAGWTLALFLLARAFGPSLVAGLQRWNIHGGVFLSLMAVGYVALRVVPRLRSAEVRRRWRLRLVRLTRWEFWPPALFYLPIALHYLRLALRHRSFTLPTAANPGIHTGGLVGESKMETLQTLMETSPDFVAPAALIPAGPAAERVARLHQILHERGWTCPFVLKPDIGQRGVGVKVVRDLATAIHYVEAVNVPLVAQRYAPGPFEIGVFYYRRPSEPSGRIFAITEKVFPAVIGDGRRTVEELIYADDRARLVADTYLRRLGAERLRVPAVDESVPLVQAGNHAQGCIFRDGGSLASPALELRLDEISQKLPGFYIGRYDLRFSSLEELREGRVFQILELNGAAAEPTNAYDARHSLLQAYRILFRQWDLVFAIGAELRARGVRPLGWRPLWQAWRSTHRLIATYPTAD